MKANHRLLPTALVLAVVTASLWAQTATTPKTKKKQAAADSAAPAITAADVQSLKDAIAAQQHEIQQLTQQLQQNQQAWQQTQQQLQQAQSTAADAQQKATSVQAASDQQQSTVTKLSSDVADVKGVITNSVTTVQDDQKRVSAIEALIGRFRFTGDMRVRGEDFFQQGVPDRNRARIRARLGVEGQLNHDFNGGIFMATGSLGDTSANETLTNYFGRMTIGLDRGYVTYNPVAHNWLTLTGGKFVFPWARTSMTFKPDINPEGFDAKLSFDTHNTGPLHNFSVQSMWLPFLEVSKGPDSYAVGGSFSGRLDFFDGVWTATPTYTLLNWHNADALLSASAFAVQATSTGVDSSGTNNGNISGEGPGCAAIQNVPTPASLSFAPCAYAPGGMTNSTYVTLDSKGNPTAHFQSKFLYSDFILNNQFKTSVPRFPINLTLEFEDNLNAAADPYNTKGKLTSLDPQSKAYGLDVSAGKNLVQGIFGYQAKTSNESATTALRNDVQFGYSWWRIEQDAIISSWGETDSRAPTNVLQNRFYAAWRPQKNVTALYSMWFGRTLNTNLENNAASINKTITTAGTQEPTLKRLQFDLIYAF